tara:strand:+ start:8201 stop:8857 length:657 start_codon:yes stop_codon:yes gene_type:complete
MSFATVAIIGAAAGLAQVGIGLSRRKKAKKDLEDAKLAQQKALEDFQNQEISNPYENLENTFEDLTVNTQAAEFEAKQNQQAQADIMGNLKGAAGSSGIAGLAQAMANKTSVDSEKASAKMAQQESANDRMKAQGAASVQSQKAAGEASRQQRELARDEAILGMKMGETAANQQMVADNNAMIMGGIGNVASAGMQYAGGGMTMKRRPKGKIKKAKKK